MTSTLKSCPCCGFDKPQMDTTAGIQSLPVSMAVLDLVICPGGQGGCGMQSGYYDTEAEAIAAWNRRTLVEDLAALIRQLVHSLSTAKPNNSVSARAMDFLTRKGLAGNILRAPEKTD